MTNNIHDNPYWKEIIQKREDKARIDQAIELERLYSELDKKHQAMIFLVAWRLSLKHCFWYAIRPDNILVLLHAIMQAIFG